MSVRILNGAESTFYDFDLSYQNGNIAGRLSWDQDNATAQIGLNQNVVARVAQDDMWYVKNQTGASIPKGTVVSAVGTVGASGRILVAPSVGNGSVPAKFILGIAAETIADGSDGYVISKGKLRSIDTSLYSAGDVLWLNPSVNGGLTATEPQAPNLKISIAFVVHSSVSAGVLAVRTDSGNDLYDDSRVQMIGTPSTGQLLRYNANRWENWSPNFVTTSRTINIAGTANQVTVVGGTQDLSANRTWTLSLPQNIHTGASPTFAGANLNASSSSYGILKLTQTNTTGEMSLSFGRSNQTNEQRWTIGLGTGGSGDSFGIYHNGLNRLIIGTNGSITLSGVTNATGDFVTIDGSNNLRRRTAAQTLTDIGAQAALTNPVTGTGAAGRVAFWTGTTTQSSDAGLFWDNTNKRLGVGTTSPTSLLTLRSSGNSTVRFEDSGTTSVSQITRQAGTGLEFIVSTSVRDFFFKENANNLMVIKGTGNVGIGTTSPNAKLQITNGSFGVYHNTAGSSGAQIYLGDTNFDNTSFWNSAAGIGAVLSPVNGVAGDLAFYVYTGIANSRTERMRITSSGNVGIGTTEPQANLHVNGSSARLRVGPFFSTNDRDYIELIANSTDTKIVSPNERFHIENNAGDIIINPSGNVGIGTTTPNERLTVIGNISVGFGGGTKIGYSVHDAFTAFSSSAAQYGMSFSGSATPVVLSGYYGVGIFTNSTERIRVSQTGNVGIGTTSPGGKLEVNFTAAQGATALILKTSDTPNSNGTIRWQNSSSTNQAGIGSNFNVSDNGALEFLNGTTTNVIIRSGGNVGIGTTAPTAKLHVSGDFESGYAIKMTGTHGTGREFGWKTNGGNSDVISLYNVTSGNRMAFFGDNEVGLQTQGSVRLYITSAGNVGIGTTSPSQLLDVLKTSNEPIAVRVSNLSSGTGAFAFLNAESDVAGGALFASSSTHTQSARGGRASTVGILTSANTTGGLAFLARNAAGIITLHTGGDTERMRITSTGNVGIGTTSPVNKLQISEGGTGSFTGLRINKSGDGVGDIAALVLQVSSNNSGEFGGKIGVVRQGASARSDMFFSVTNDSGTLTERLRITKDGNVGIGTTSPSSLLHVGGLSGAVVTPTAIQMDNTYRSGTPSFDKLKFYLFKNSTESYGIGLGNVADVQYWAGSSSTGAHTFFTRQTERMRITSTGNVGIGATAPTQRLHINGSGARILIQDTNQGAAGFVAGRAAGEVFLGNDGALPLSFLVNNAERMRITSAGNVGIGDSSPSDMLVVNGRTRINGTNRLAFGNSSGGYAQIGVSGALEGNLQFLTFNGTSLLERMRITLDGNVGIGTTSPAQKLDVSGSIRATTGLILTGNAAKVSTTFAGVTVTNFFTDAGGGVISVDGSNRISLRQGGVSGTDAITIAGSGNVGIGTTSPSTLLHVNGVITATGGNSTNWNTAFGWGDHSLGGYLTGNQTITLSGDVTGSGATAITTTIANNAVTTAKIADRAVTLGKLPQPSSYSVLGNAAGFTPSNYADIVAGANSILRRDGTGNLTFGSLQTAMIADAAVTFAKISSGSALSVLGRSANSTGVMASIAAGTDGHVLRRSGTTLGFGTIGNASISGLAWSKITSTPTTLAGYGITDALFGINQVQGRVAFWSGVENQVSGSGSFFWDNTNIRLGIGTAAPVGSLDVSRFNTQNDIYFHNGTTYNTTTNVALYFGTANYSAVNNGTTFRYKWWMDGIATGKDLVLSRQQFNGSTVVNTESFRLTSSGAASFAGSLTIGSIANGTGSFLTHSSGLVRSRTAAQVLADLGIQNNVVPDDIVCMTLTANETFTTGDLVIPYDSAYTDPTTRYETGGYISVNEGEEWTFTVRTTVTAGSTPVSAFTVQIFGADSDKVAVEPYGANINMGTISGTTVVVNVSCIVKIPSGTDFVGVRILNTQSQSRTITSGRHLNGFEGKRIK